MHRFAVKLKSREHLQEAAEIFGYSDTYKFIKRFTEIEEQLKEGKFEIYRYNSAFEIVPIKCQYVKSEELGSRN